MTRELTLYYDPRTGAALMVASGLDDAVYFPYDIDTGKFRYGMHGSPLKEIPVQYFAAQPLAIKNRLKTTASDIQVIKVPRQQPSPQQVCA